MTSRREEHEKLQLFPDDRYKCTLLDLSGTLGIREKGVSVRVPSKLVLQVVVFPIFLNQFSYLGLLGLCVGGWSEVGEGVDGGQQGGAKPIWTFPHYKVSARLSVIL